MAGRQGDHLRGKPRPEGAGRKKGTPNRLTMEFKAIVQDLIDENKDNVKLWLKQTAEGVPERRHTDAEGVQHISLGVAPDPAKATDLITKLAEYAAPKLSRQEVTGAGGQPLAPPVLQVVIEPPRDASLLPDKKNESGK